MYLSVCSLTLIMSVPVQKKASDVIFKNITEEINTSMLQGMDMLDLDFENMLSTAVMLMKNKHFSHIDLLNNDLTSKDYVRALYANNYFINLISDFKVMDKADIFFLNNSIILSTRRMFIGEIIDYNDFYSYSNMDIEQFRSLIFAQPYYTKILASQEYSDYDKGNMTAITCLLSMPVMSPNDINSVMVTIINIDEILHCMLEKKQVILLTRQA